MPLPTVLLERGCAQPLSCCRHASRRPCGNRYGYDILLDDTLKPWLIEVNASPSLSADTKDDYKLKYGMLEDMFGILTLGKVGLDQNYRRVGGFDLMWNDGEVEEVTPQRRAFTRPRARAGCTRRALQSFCHKRPVSARHVL